MGRNGDGMWSLSLELSSQSRTGCNNQPHNNPPPPRACLTSTPTPAPYLSTCLSPKKEGHICAAGMERRDQNQKGLYGGGATLEES